MAIGTALAGRQFVDRFEVDAQHLLDDQLSDQVSAVQFDRCSVVGVEQADFDLPAVAGVYGARRIDDRQPAASSKSRARMHETRVAVRQCDRDAGRHQDALPRLDHHVDRGGQIRSCIAGAGVGGQRQPIVDHPDWDYQLSSAHLCKVSSRCRAQRWPRMSDVSDAADKSNPTSGIEFKIIAGALGAVATFAVQKLIRSGWKQITGQEPPDPNDPDASAVAAIAWVAASAVGVSVAQVVTRRFAAKRYRSLGH